MASERITNYTEARQVVDGQRHRDRAPVIITRTTGDPVVMLANRSTTPRRGRDDLSQDDHSQSKDDETVRGRITGMNLTEDEQKLLDSVLPYHVRATTLDQEENCLRIRTAWLKVPP